MIEDLINTRKQLELAGTIRWFHWLIVCSSLLLTFGAWYFSKTQLEAKISMQFDREADQVVALIVDRMKKYEDALWSGVALIQTTGGDVSYPEWETFATSLRIEEKYPGINGIGVIHRVIPEQLDSYLQDQRAIRPDYAIHPPHQESEYWPITYVAPVGSNAKAVGLDMAHETNRFTAGKKARDTGLAQITGPITLVQDSAKTPGFLFYAPYYKGGRYESIEIRRDRFIGMVYAPFIVNKLMQGVLAQVNRHVGLRMVDQGDVLYDEHRSDNPDFDVDPLFQKEVTIPLYGRDWMFDIRSTQAFRSSTTNSQPIIILVGGLIIDGLLLGLFILISRGSRKALLYADAASRGLTQEHHRLQAVMDTAVDGIITIDDKGTIQDCNPAASTIFGYLPDEMVGQNVKMLMPSPYHEEHDGYLDRYQETGEQHIIGSGGRELIGRRKDGTIFPMDLSVGEMQCDGLTFFSGLVRDISERKEAEKTLQAKNHDLVIARDEALVAVRSKAMFLATMSHEIRTPMNGILGMTELLTDTELSVDQQDLLRTLHSSGENLLAIINDILDFSKIESGKLTIEQIDFDLRTSVEEVLNILSLQAQAKGLELVGLVNANTPTALRGDPVRFRQVLTNLVGNALKFTATGEVFLRVAPLVCTDSEAHIRVEVKDTGIGMSAEEQKTLFQAFTQANQSTTRKYGGTGLGLAISHQLVELMQGEIGVDSTPGTGSCFWFTLKFPIQSTPPAKRLSEVSLTDLRILFVDDNATNRFILDHYAESWGMTSSSASSSAQGAILLEAAAGEGHPFDLVVIDQKMPDMDGFEFANMLKGTPRWQALPLILLTSLGYKGEANHAKQAHFSGYLTKPIHQQTLRRAVALVMGLEQESDKEDVKLFITRHTVQEQEMAEKPRILLAEDNLVNQKVAVRMLTKLGYQVDVANNGQEALEAWGKKPYQVILMDCLMPEMDGFQTTQKIREAEAMKSAVHDHSPDALPFTSAHIPIIAMTANTMEGDREKCLEVGMDDFIPKPVKIDFLAEVVDKWLSPNPAEESQKSSLPIRSVLS